MCDVVGMPMSVIRPHLPLKQFGFLFISYHGIVTLFTSKDLKWCLKVENWWSSEDYVRYEFQPFGMLYFLFGML